MKNECTTRLSRTCYAWTFLLKASFIFLTFLVYNDAEAQCLEARNDTVMCTHSLADIVGSPDVQFWPDTLSSCDLDELVNVTHNGDMIDSIYDDCSIDRLISKSIVRQYTALYKDGTRESIFDTTWVYAVNLRDGGFICFTGPDTISCGSESADALEDPTLRAPMYYKGTDTIALYPQNPNCKIVAVMNDDVWSSGCGEAGWIFRTWTIKDPVCGLDTTCVDTLVIIDTIPPSVLFDQSKLELDEHDFDGNLIELLTDTISTGHGCLGHGRLPQPLISDDCTENAEIIVSISSPTVVLNIPSYRASESPDLSVWDVPIGKHLVIYKVNECHTVYEDSIVIVVADKTPAVAVCHDAVNLTLTNIDDFTLMKATSMDAESYDNCYLYEILARRTDWLTACQLDTTAADGENAANDFYRRYEEWVKNDPGICQGTFELGFAPQVPFCCDDVGDEIMVEIMVIDQNCNVDRCWGIVNVESKIAPLVIEELLDDTITCSAYQANFKIDVESANLVALNSHFGKYVFDLAQQEQWILNDIDCDGAAEERTYWDGLLQGACATTLIETVKGPDVACAGGFIERKWETVVITHTGTDTIPVATQKIFIKQCPMANTIGAPPSDVQFFACDITYGLDGNTTLVTEGPDLSAATNDCRHLGVGFVDKVFDVVAGQGCKKVLRTWCVLDWCDPDLQDAADWNHIAGLPGVMTYTQKIIVSDTVAPILSAPSILQTNRTVNCSASLEVSVEVSDDCGVSTAWTVQSMNGTTHASGQGLTASASALPPGGYILRFVATDGCGNQSSEMTTFNVASDAQPSVVAHTMLTAQLTPMDTDGDNVVDAGMATVWAKEYNSSSAPPCGGDPNNLIYLLRIDDGAVDPTPPATDETAIIFDCSDKVGDGIVLLQFWVMDTVSNTSDFSYVFVDLDDNSGICGGTVPPASVNGIVITEASQQVANVKVTAETDKSKSEVISRLDGSFAVNVPAHQAVTLIPEKNTDFRNGISTLDLVKIQKHILGLKTLNSPYQLIAADANRDGKINPIDIIQLRKLIISTIDELPTNTSWRFVAANHEFKKPHAAHTEDFPEEVQIGDGQQQVRIVGIKIGDLDGNVVTSRARSASDAVELEVEDLEMKAGQQYQVRLTGERTKVLGYQMALAFDHDQMELKGLQSDQNGFSSRHYHAEDGMVRVSWSSIDDQADEITLVLEVKALTDVKLHDVLSVNNEALGSEAILSIEEAVPIRLNFVEKASMTLHQNRPNPFSAMTQIDFVQPDAGAVSLTVYDLAGRVVKTIEGEYPAGANSIPLSASDLPIGILSYTLATNFGTRTKRMILIR